MHIVQPTQTQLLNVTNTNNKAHCTNIQVRTGNEPKGLKSERARAKRARARTGTGQTGTG